MFILGFHIGKNKITEVIDTNVRNLYKLGKIISKVVKNEESMYIMICKESTMINIKCPHEASVISISAENLQTLLDSS